MRPLSTLSLVYRRSIYQIGTILLDFSNTSNSIDCGCMFEEIQTCIPPLIPWMESCYGAQPILHLGDNQILSRCRVQQGDPLGPLGFALTLQPIVERIKTEVPGLKINAWYLDDGTLCGSAVDLAAALSIVEQDGPTRGLNLNRSKSLLYIPDDCRSVQQSSPAWHTNHKGRLHPPGLSNWSLLLL